jgi:hypothetical protein
LSIAALDATSLAIEASFLAGWPAASRLAASYQAEPGRVRPRLHVRQLELDRLVVAKVVTERRAVGDVAQALGDAPGCEAGSQRGDRHPSLVQGRQELGIAAAALAEQVVGGNPAGVEGQFSGV